MVTDYFWEVFADVKIDCLHSLLAYRIPKQNAISPCICTH